MLHVVTHAFLFFASSFATLDLSKSLNRLLAWMAGGAPVRFCILSFLFLLFLAMLF